MGMGETFVVYLLIGLGVAGAVYLSGLGRSPAGRLFRVVTAVVFWPLFLPLLLAKDPSAVEPEAAPRSECARDGMAAVIAQVNAELEAALESLEGWAEGVLTRETGRIDELRVAWSAQAARIREMDRLLACTDASALAITPATPGPSERLRASERVRQQNLERLQKVRQQAHDDLLGSLAWVRELVSMIHLAKFTGAPAARAEELVAQIAAAVEGLSETIWQEEAAQPSGKAEEVVGRICNPAAMDGLKIRPTA